MDAQVQLPQTAWEQRKPFYKDIEALIAPGFLSHNVMLSGIQLALRSPCPGDMFLIQHRAGVGNSEEDWLLWSVATCIWMLDGVVLLGDPAAPTRVAKLLRDLPKRTRKVLYVLYLKLFSRVSDASDGMLAFCYEERSRSLWHQFGQRTPANEETVGIPNVGKLGSNMIQRMWTAYNLVEDQRRQELSAWTHAKFVASAHHPKGVKQVSQREKQLQESRLTRHQEEMDLNYYRCIGVVTGESTADGRKVFRKRKSIPELQDEYKSWVDGEADQHDLIVQQWKEKIIQRHEEESRRRAQFWAQQQSELAEERAAAEAESTEEPQRLVGYDATQIAEIMGERKQATPGARRVYDDQSAKREYIYQEHLKQQPLPPPKDGFFPKESISSPQQGDSLNDQLRQRKARLGPGPPQRQEE